MKDTILKGILIIAFCAIATKAQWTPDPFCPYPSDHVTRYPYYGNCSLFWECYEGAKYVMECPQGLEFNAPLQQCDAPGIANCNPFASTTGNPNPPTYSTHTTPSQGPGPDCPFPSDVLTFFPYPGDCTKYWECFSGNAYLYNCPEGLWWHQAIEDCDYPGEYCDGSTGTTGRTTPPVSTTTHHGQPTCDSTGHIFYPYYGDCTKYWECSNGKLYLYDCPSGLWWHQAISECDYPGDFCDNSTTPTVTPPTPPTWPTDLPECGFDGHQYYPYPYDCSKFWECANGLLYLYTCPPNLWWHQEILNCDYPGNYCDGSNMTTNPTPPTIGPPTCNNIGDEDEYWPYPYDCEKYWLCTNGGLYLVQCPTGFWWHPSIQSCDFPGPYCYQITTTTQLPTTPAFECPAEGNSYWPDPYNCHFFIECVDGNAYQLACPPGLYYSASQNKCVEPEDSECCAEHGGCNFDLEEKVD